MGLLEEKTSNDCMKMYPFWIGNSFTAGKGLEKRKAFCAVLCLRVKQMENSIDWKCELGR